MAPGLGGEADLAAVRRPGDGAAERRDALELDAALAADHAAPALAVERRHHVDVGVLPAVREVGDAIALRRDRGRGVEAAPVATMVGQAAGELVGVLLGRDRRPVGLAHPGAPLLVELVHRHAHAALERPVEGVHRADALEHVAQPVLAVALHQIRDRRLALLVDDVPAGVGQRRQIAIHHAVAHEHLLVRLDPQRHVLGQALGEPERHREEALAGDERGRRAAVHHVEHEGVGELVHHDVAEVLVGPGEGQHHPVAQHLGEPAGAGVDQLGGDVGLGKVVVGAVDDDGDPLAQGVPHPDRQHGVGLLGQVQRPAGEAVEPRVVVDLEVVRGERAPVVVAVLDLVLAEVLRGGTPGDDQGDGQRQGEPGQTPRHAHAEDPFLATGQRV